MATRKAFPLRIDPQLYRQLEAWAQQELRSVNGQIEYLLKRAVAGRERAAGADSTDEAAGRSGPGGASKK